MQRHAFVQHFISNRENEGRGTEEHGVDLAVTCLSESVSQLLTKFEYEGVVIPRHDLVQPDTGLLIWKTLEDNVPQGNRESSRFLQNVCRTIEIGEDISTLVGTHENLLKNLNQPYDLIKHLLCHEQSDDHLVFGCLSTITERLIASIFLTMVNRNASNKVLPNTLSEMLESEELRQCLGEKCIYIISILIGPPAMLNLRNVLWHGFCGRHELEHCYVTFLVRLYLSICERVLANLQQEETFILKSQISLKLHDDIEENSRVRGLRKLVEKWPDVPHDPDFLSSCKRVINNSYFNVPHRQSLIISAFEHYDIAARDPTAPQAQYHLLYSLCILFPQFEHALRRLFVAVNADVPDRLLCAESEELFSTLDIILANVIAVSDQRKFVPNQLGSELGDPLCDALFDAFMQYTGPRLRDKVAHCEVSELEPRLVLHYLYLYLALCHRYSRTVEQNDFITTSVIQHFSLEQYPIGLFDCRTLFISNWNRFVTQVLPRFVDKYVEVKWDIMEVTENECRFDVIKGTFTYGKKKETEPTNVQEVINTIKNSKGKAKTGVSLTVQEMEQILTQALGHDLATLPLMYKNHYYICEQQASNVNMCGRMIRHHLHEVMTVIEEKIDTLSTMIEERKARTAQRKAYGASVNLMNLIVLAIRVLASMVLRVYVEMDENGKDETFYKQKLAVLLKIMTQVERFHEAAKTGAVGNFLATFVKYVITN
jgi:hypothetical protein